MDTAMKTRYCEASALTKERVNAEALAVFRSAIRTQAETVADLDRRIDRLDQALAKVKRPTRKTDDQRLQRGGLAVQRQQEAAKLDKMQADYAQAQADAAA